MYFQTAAFCHHKSWDCVLIRRKKITNKLIAIKPDFKKTTNKVKEKKNKIAKHIIPTR